MNRNERTTGPGIHGQCPECGDIQVLPEVLVLPIPCQCPGCGEAVEIQKYTGDGSAVGNTLHDPGKFDPCE